MFEIEREGLDRQDIIDDCLEKNLRAPACLASDMVFFVYVGVVGGWCCLSVSLEARDALVDLDVTKLVMYQGFAGAQCLLGFTCSMATYSTMTEPIFIPSVVQMATSVEAMATKDMTNGPSSLQTRSILRIRAFITGTKSENHATVVTTKEA